MRMVHHGFTCLNTWWNSLGSFRRSGLVGGNVSLEASVEFQKTHAIPRVPLCLVVGSQVVSSLLLLQHHTCLPVAMLPAMIVMGCNLLRQ